jgi:Na+/melibiose symporter-like transporter
VLPALAGLAAAAVALAVMAAVAVPLAWRGPWPAASATSAEVPASPAPEQDPVASPWADGRFRHLLTVFVLNGVAAAIPATLFPFFVRDRLQQPEQEPLLLGAYFLAAVLSLPAWVAVVRRIGLARSWALGMALAATAFCVTPWLGAGDARAFLLVCLASGLALGADLAVPAALLAAVVRDAGHQGVGEGRHFGWWQAATKMNLALAAGLSLPLLDLAGYQPGARDPQALGALSMAYAALPCAVKLLALITWWPAWRRAPSLRPHALERTT